MWRSAPQDIIDRARLIRVYRRGTQPPAPNVRWEFPEPLSVGGDYLVRIRGTPEDVHLYAPGWHALQHLYRNQHKATPATELLTRLHEEGYFPKNFKADTEWKRGTLRDILSDVRDAFVRHRAAPDLECMNKVIMHHKREGGYRVHPEKLPLTSRE
jgi:hypothetical protein